MENLTHALRAVLDSKSPLLSAETKRILLKEALQGQVLDFLYNHPLYRELNFYGGTCLHVVYGLERLSEDLDLDNGSGLPVAQLQDDLPGMFMTRFGYADVAIKTQQGGNGVFRATLKFPILNTLGLSAYDNEALHLKVEISHHRQTAVIQKTPVFYHGRSFVPSHFSLETMMAGKMIACIERNFQRGREGAFIKGRDFYDLLWFMQKGIQPLAGKLQNDGKKPYTVQTAMSELGRKVASIRTDDLKVDLLPMFESSAYVQNWLSAFHANFERYAEGYLK